MKLINELRKHSHPLNTDSSQLYNIVNGQCVHPEINVHNALDVGKKQAEDFVGKLTDGFHKPIAKQVKTMRRKQWLLKANQCMILRQFLHIF